MELLVRFAIFKIPVTVLSFCSLWTIRQGLGEMFWAAWANSLLTQVIEFLVLRSQVFKENGWSRKLVTKQFTTFWGWACVIGFFEGWMLSRLERAGLSYPTVYMIGHVPTFFLRFLGDRFIFRKRNIH